MAACEKVEGKPDRIISSLGSRNLPWITEVVLLSVTVIFVCSINNWRNFHNQHILSRYYSTVFYHNHIKQFST